MRVETVTGPILPENLKITLPHEHLMSTFTVWHTMPEEASKRALFEAPITLSNRGELMRDAGISRNNLTMLDEAEAIEELMEFKKCGGSSLVELTAPGVGRDPLSLKRISQATSIHIICSSGFYVGSSHPEIVKHMDVGEVRDFVLRELQEGISYPFETEGIKAGIIKCATNFPISSEEEKVFNGAARAQKDSGAPFTIHPTLIDVAAKKKVFDQEKIITLIQAEGANLEKFYMSHMDQTCSDDRGRVNIEYHKRLLDKYPLTLNYDTIGNEAWWYSLWPGALFFGDSERLLALAELCEQGYEKQLMMSQDVFTKLQRIKYGGWGYAYILKHIEPRLRYMGVSKKQIDTMMIDNPKRILAY